MKIACLTPLPPTRSGISHYASLLLPHLGRAAEVTAVVNDEDVEAGKRLLPEPRSFSIMGFSAYRARRSAFDVAVYQLGNNPHHEQIYDEALAHRGVAVLHDQVLHHLIVEKTLARGDVDEYAAVLRANHGEMGEAWARGRAAGMHDELANFVMPASVQLANRSGAVIVHNQYAAARLLDLGVHTPLVVVPLPYDATADASGARDAVRARLGYASATRVIGMFGFLTSSKRAEVVLAAFADACRRDATLRLLVVGEPAPNVDVDALVRDSGLRRDAVTFTGYVSDADFAQYAAAIDRMINLRYPTAGESSGTLLQAFQAGKPVAVSGYAQFAEFPDDTVTKIPLGAGEHEALLDFMTGTLDTGAIAAAQHAWLAANASSERAVAAYMQAVELALKPATNRAFAAAMRTLPVLTSLQLLDATCEPLSDGRTKIVMRIRNGGDMTIRTRSYGMPGYRVLVKLFDGDVEVADRWLEPSGDLAPGQIASLELSLRLPHAAALRLTLYDALEGIPLLEVAPWGATEIASAPIR